METLGDMSPGVAGDNSRGFPPVGGEPGLSPPVASPVSPLNTPPDWFARIDQRRREWAEMGPEAALRAWRARQEMGKATLDMAEQVFRG